MFPIVRKRLALRMAGVSILALVYAPTAAAQLDVGIFMGPTISAMSGTFVGNTSSTLIAEIVGRSGRGGDPEC